MRTLLFSIIYCLLSVSLSAQTLSEQDIIQRMASAADEIKTIQCNFTQTRHMKMLSKGQVSKGRMYCKQPDKLRWEYTTPRTNTLIMNGADVRLRKEETANTSKNKFIGEMARMIMNSVAGKCLTDNKSFQVTANEMPKEYVVTLLPLRKEMKRIYSKLVLHFDIKQSTVTEVELFEKSGDSTVIELYDIQINGQINPEIFVF